MQHEQMNIAALYMAAYGRPSWSVEEITFFQHDVLFHLRSSKVD